MKIALVTDHLTMQQIALGYIVAIAIFEFADYIYIYIYRNVYILIYTYVYYMVVSVTMGFMLYPFIGYRQGYRHHYIYICVYIYNSSIIDIEQYLKIPQNLVHQ